MSKMSRKAPTLVLNSLNTTAVVTAAAVAIMGLSGCAPDPDAVNLKVYGTPEACVQDGGQLERCERDDATAKVLHTNLAPKYDSKVDCEEDWGSGRCEEKAPTAPAPVTSTTHGGGGFVYISPYNYYSPYYAGYASGGSPSGSYYSSAQPVYRAANGSVYTSAGTAVQHGGSYHAGALQTPSKAAQFAGGTSVSKGNSTAQFGGSNASAKPSGSVKSGGFGSAGRAGGSVSVGG